MEPPHHFAPRRLPTPLRRTSAPRSSSGSRSRQRAAGRSLAISRESRLASWSGLLLDCAASARWVSLVDRVLDVVDANQASFADGQADHVEADRTPIWPYL